MTEENICLIASLCVFFATVGYLIGLWHGWVITARVEHDVAVIWGVGRWEVDPTTGKRRFRYGKKPDG